MKATILQLKRLFLEIATEHKQINAFFWGDFLRAQKSDVINYPLLNVFVDNANITRNGVNVTLVVTVADKVFKDYTNIDEVQSDALLVCKDIIDVMSSDKWRAFCTVAQSSGFNPFVDDSLDEVTGWVGTINLDITSVRNLCAIPFTDYDFEGNYVNNCPGVKIFIDGEFSETVPSGGDYFITSGGVCLPANYVVKYEDDTPIESGTVASGGTVTVLVPNCPTPEPCADATAVLKDSAGDTLSTTNIASGASEDITAPDGVVNVRKSDNVLISAQTVKSNGAENYPVADSVVTLNDTANGLISTTNVKATDAATIVAPDGVVTITDTTPTTLHTVNVKSNGAATQQINDAVVTLNNTVPTLISTTNVKAQGTATVVAPDATAVVKDSAGTTLKSEAIPSNVSEDITINDSTVNVRKSDSTLISAISVKAEATEAYNVADSVVNVNASKLADVKATDTLNITVVDSNDDSVSVTLSGGNKITIPSLPCSGGTCNDAYKLGADFYTLDRNNPFGNTNRFTAIDGTQTYTDGIVIDWLFARDYAETVVGYGVSIISPATHAVQIGNEPYTIGAFGGFTLIHHINLFRIVNDDGTKAPANGLDYSPFNYVITGANNTRIRSGDNFYNDTTQTWLYNNNGNLAQAVKTLSVSTMIQRQFTYTELGI
jgi:hypothetical protein